MKYTDKEIEFLTENYPKYGGKYCQPFLKNRKIDAIQAMAARCGLKAKNKVIYPNLQKININKFLNINTKEIAYFLGYFWADGYIHHYISNNINNWRIAFEIKSEDANNIMNIMDFVGNWSKQVRKRSHWKETTTFVTNNKDLYNFLFENGYNEKSDIEPTAILSKIPTDLKIYFWKGVIDGDGSIGLVGKYAFFELSSAYNYLYKEFSKWLNSFNVSGNIYRQISKKGHKSSVYKIYGKKILPIIEILPKYGLLRKNEKLTEIKNKYEK